MWITTLSSVVVNTAAVRTAVWGAAASGSSAPALITDLEAKPFLDRPVLYLSFSSWKLQKIWPRLGNPGS